MSLDSKILKDSGELNIESLTASLDRFQQDFHGATIADLRELIATAS